METDSSVSYKTVNERGIQLPKELYKENNPTSNQRSPYATFDPVEATKGEGWVNSTTPLSKPQKKSLIMDVDSFVESENIYSKMGVVASLNSLGFDVYIKQENGSFAYFDSSRRKTLKQLEDSLKTVGKFSKPHDFTTLVETYQIAQDESLVIDPSLGLFIHYESLTEDNVKRLNQEDQNIGCCFVHLSPKEAVNELTSFEDSDYYYFLENKIEVKLNPLINNLFENGHIEMVRKILGLKINQLEPLVMLKAAQKGVLDIVEKCIAHNVNINTQDIENDRTALMWAVIGGNVEIVQKLLENGAEVNLQDIYGATTLMWAVIGGNVEIVQKLLENGAEVNFKEIHDTTALMLAAKMGNPEIVQKLLENGAEVNHKNIHDNTALMFAVMEGNDEIVKKLLENGAKVNEQNRQDITSPPSATLQDNSKIVQKLLEEGNELNLQNLNCASPLIIATECGHHKIVELLLENKAEVNLQNLNGDSALTIAAQNGHYNIAKLLLKNKASINKTNLSGNSALFFAIQSDHSNIAELLIDYKADINLENKYGETALTWAAIRGNIKIAQKLLKNGAEVNQQNKHGTTAIMWAAEKGHVDIVQLFLDNEANVNIKNSTNTTALFGATILGNPKIVEQLLENGAEVNSQNKTLDTALISAAFRGHTEAVQKLIEYGADTNIRNYQLYSPLHFAAQNGYYDIAEMLLKNKAKINLQNINKNSALMVASHNGRSKMVELLLKNKAEVNFQDIYGTTALMVAAQKAYTKIVELLIIHGAAWKKEPKLNTISIEKDESPSKLARKIVNTFKTIYLANNEPERSLTPSIGGEVYSMYPAGELLNGNSHGIKIRTKILHFKDITKTLDYDITPSITYNRLVEIPKYDLENIEEYRNKDANEEIYCNFNLDIRSNKKVALPSLDPNEELKGLRAMVGDKEIDVNLFRGDDDFYYVQVKKPCKINFVLKADSPQKQIETYRSIEKSSVKNCIETFINTPSPKDHNPPVYNKIQHREWMQNLYKNKTGACRHFTAAIVHQITKTSPANKNNIRIVFINNNHVKLEMRHNGKWISCPDLGGLQSREIFHQKKHTLEPVRMYDVKSISNTFSFLKSVVPKKFPNLSKRTNAKKMALTKSIPKGDILTESIPEEIFEEISTPNILVDKALNDTGNHILISLPKDSIQNYAHSCIEKARQNERSVFYINSPSQIDIHKSTVFLNSNGTGTLSNHGHLEHFIENSGQSYAGPIDHNNRPLLIVNWSSFTPQQRVQYNAMLDPQASIEGKELPGHLQIISLETPINPQDYASKEAFISRHTKKFSFKGEFPNRKKALQENPHIIDLCGKPNWKAALFGPVEVKDNKILWEKSDFIKILEDKAKNKAFQIINPPYGTHDEISQTIDQAKAFGAFSYHGYDIAIDIDTELSSPDEPYNFKKFDEYNNGTNYSIVTGITIDKVSENTLIVNSHNFDQLLTSKKIDNGVYNQVPGFIEKAGKSEGQKKILKLYITSALSKSQWYLLFQQAQKHKVALHISTILNPIEIPSDLHCQTTERKDISKDMAPKSTQRPNIIITNSTKASLSTQSQDAIIIHVEDYNSLDLWFGSIETAEYNPSEDKYKNDFLHKDSPVVKALESGKKVVIAGEFSAALLHYLEPVLAGRGVANPQNLTFILENPEIKKEDKLYTPLRWLPKSHYNLEHHEITKSTQSEEALWIEKQHDTSTLDLNDSERMASRFIKTRIDNVNRCFEKYHAIKIEGQAGVGKSSLFKNHEKQLNGTVFHGLDQLKQWAAAPEKKGMQHILVIDEANIDNTHYTMFEPVKKGMGHILYQGELIPVEPHCKVAFLMNPKKDVHGKVYGGGRTDQKLFQDGEIPTLKLAPLPHVYVYQYILKKPIYNTLTPKLKERLPEKAFRKMAFDAIENNVNNEFTPREIQETVLKSLAQSVFEDQFVSKPTSITTHEFLSTPETKDSQLKLEQTLSIRQLEHRGYINKNACGKPGVLIEGNPGLGKSEMIKAVLKNKGVQVITEEKEVMNTTKQYCFKIDASLPLKNKKEIIQKAFDEGNMVWIDEINSCINDGLEKVLNAAMAGQNPKTGLPPNKGGFMVLATANSAAMEGRSILGEALISRFNQSKMTPFDHYTDDSLRKIIKNMLKNKDTTSKEIDVVSEKMLQDFKKNRQIHNIRDIATHINENSKSTKSALEKLTSASNEHDSKEIKQKEVTKNKELHVVSKQDKKKVLKSSRV